MKGKFTKRISFIVSALMALSLISSRPVNAADNNKAIDGALKKQVSEAYRKSLTNVKDLKGKYEYFNDNVDNSKTQDPNEDVRIIVELEEKSVKQLAPRQKKISEAANDKSLLNKVQGLRQPYEDKVKDIDNSINIRNKYSVLLNGFSAEVKNKDIDEIKKIPGVKHVTVAKKYYPDMNYAKDLTNATKAWKDYGLTGERMVVAIVDTGIDSTHKDMRLSDSNKAKLSKEKIDGMTNDKGKFYTEKVPYGYNFADQNDVVKDTTSSMHGMHVAGIVGANCGNEEDIKIDKGIKGIAPECQLLAMKVFSNDPNNSGAFSDDIVAAIEDSVKHDADVINMSLGSSAAFQDPEDAEQKAIKEATDSGVSVVVSAGNSYNSMYPLRVPGIEDTGLVGSPGLAEDSLQVASYENNKVTAAAFDYSYGDKKGLVSYTTSEVDPVGVLNGEYEIVDCGLGNPNEIKDVEGKIALIKRGGLSFIEKKINAQAKGAAGTIVYNADGDDSFINMATDPQVTTPGIFIINSDGEMLKANIGNGLKISFNGTPKAVDNVNANAMSDFTSWGPTPNLDFKPEITAPGGQIWSTVNDNKYQAMSGTSMASPHMAGCMALIMQHIDKMVDDKEISFNSEREKVEFAEKLACNTAQVMLDESTNKKLPYSPRRQGAGMVNVEDALKNKVTVTYNEKPVAALKEIENKEDFTLKLHNYGDTDVTYNIKSLTDNLLTDVYEFGEVMPYEQVIDNSTITLEPENITVKANNDAEVEVSLNIPNETKLYNVFAEGFIRFIPENNEKFPQIGIPFMGFYGEWDDESIFDEPVWSDNAIFGYTQLLMYFPELGGYYSMGKTDEHGNTSDPNTIAISNSEEDGVNTNIVPVITLFRNAKQLKVEILDSNKNVIKTVSNNINIRKNILFDNTDPGYRLLKNALWDGTVYDKTTGQNKKAADGKYTLRVKGCIDYKDAKMQELDMPVKVDSVEPVIDIPKMTKVTLKQDGTYECIVTFKANDGTSESSSGLDRFVFAINGDICRDNEGDVIFINPEDIKKEDGSYSYTFNLNKEPQLINVLALDYAGNIGIGGTEGTQNIITINSPKDGGFADKNCKVEFTLREDAINNSEKVNVLLDGEKVGEVAVEKNKKNYEYELKDLSDSMHFVELYAVKSGEEGKEDNIIAYGQIGFTVSSNDFGLVFKNIQSGLITNEPNYTIMGSITTKPDKFTINGIDMLKSEDVYWSYGMFVVNVKLTPGQLSKVPVFASKGQEEEEGYKEYNYCYEIYCDTEAPVITTTQPVFEEGEDSATVVVPENTEKYTVKGTVKDDMFGYNLFINGNAELAVSLNTPDGKKTLRSFEKEVALDGDTTIITLQAKDEAGNVTTKTVKVLKGKEEIIDINPFGFDKSYKNGDIVNGGIEVTNNYSIPKSVAMIVGVFDEKDNKMVSSVVVSKLVGIGEQGKEKINVQMPIPKEGEYTLRCFIWDSLDGMKPLSKLIEMKILQPEPEEVQNEIDLIDLIPSSPIEDSIEPEEPGQSEDDKNIEKPGDTEKPGDQPANPEEPEQPEQPGEQPEQPGEQEPKEPGDDTKIEEPENPENPAEP